MKLKVGDIIVHGSLGLMILVENYIDSGSSRYNIHGQPLFKMEKLNSCTGFNKWILYDIGVMKYNVRKATDDDIVEALTEELCTFNIGNQLSLEFYPKGKGLSIFGANDWIYLDIECIKALKRHLEELIYVP